MSKQRLPIPEVEIQRAIVDLLKLLVTIHPFMFFSVPNERISRAKTPEGNARIMGYLMSLGLCPGAADLVIVSNGKVYFIEVKSHTGRLSLHQKKFAQKATKCQAPYVVVRSVEDVIKFLKLHKIII